VLGVGFDQFPAEVREKIVRPAEKSSEVGEPVIRSQGRADGHGELP
jgi:hypothetical protein